MNSARRSRRRQDWPRGLYEPRPGYYVYRRPDNGQTLALGSIPLASAKAQALQANMHFDAKRPTLLERLAGPGHTVADLVAQTPTGKSKASQDHAKWLDKLIVAELGTVDCAALSVADCARVIEAVEAKGTPRSAVALRSRLGVVCKRGMQLGWMDTNPVAPTRRPEATVKRARLSFEDWQKIRAVADKVAPWLPLVMDLALVTGQDLSTIAALKRSQIVGDTLVVQRSKTAATARPVAIPLCIRLDCAGLCLKDILQARTGVISKHVVHHTLTYPTAKPGDPVRYASITRAFTLARKLAKIPDVLDGKTAPTFHEMRSLAKRLYDKQGNVDTKALLGHRSDSAAALYADSRGSEVLTVRVA